MTVRSQMMLFLLFLMMAGSSKSQEQDFGRRERTYDVRHIRIELSFDLEHKKVFGTVATTISSLRPNLREIALDAVDMTINDVEMDGSPVAFTYDSSVLVLRPSTPLRIDQLVTYRVKYECTPRRGLYIIAPDASFPGDPYQIWSQGQGEDNRHWIPCYDYPNDKATSEIFATVPDSFTTLSNGRRVSTRYDEAHHRKTVHWIQDKPHSSYLIMFAAGMYDIYEDEADGVPVLSYYYPGQEKRDVERAYGTTAEMVRFFSTLIGVPYPWDKYAQISVAYFLYGGMENTSATVLNDTRTVVSPRAALDYSPDGLIAHELAHQWWGDYVTYIDWQNGWLNEGFATFFQQCWSQYHEGEEVYRYQRWKAMENLRKWTRQVGRTPMVTNKRNGYANVYGRGAITLHMIRYMLGEELFWRVMKNYATRYAFASVESNDFKRTIEDVTGVDLYWFFKQWVYGAGWPEFDVTQSWDAEKKECVLRVRQVQERDDLCRDFRVMLDIKFSGDGWERVERVDIASADTTLRFRLATQPRLVSFNHGLNAMCTLSFDKTTDELVYQVRRDDDFTRRIWAGRQLVARAGEPGVFEALAEALRADPFYGVQEVLLDELGRVNIDSVIYRRQLKALYRSLLDNAKPTIRARAVNGLSRYHDRTLRPFFREKLNDSSYYVEAGALSALAQLDSLDAIPLLMQYLDKNSFRNVLRRTALSYLSSMNAVAALPKIRRLAQPGPSLVERRDAVLALSEFADVEPAVLGDLSRILEEPSWRMRLVAIQALGRLSTPLARRILEERRKYERHPLLKRWLERVLRTPKK